MACSQADFFNLEACVTFDSCLLPRCSKIAIPFTHCKLGPGWRSSDTWVPSSAQSYLMRAKLTPVKTKICTEEISKHWPFFFHFFSHLLADSDSWVDWGYRNILLSWDTDTMCQILISAARGVVYLVLLFHGNIWDQNVFHPCIFTVFKARGSFPSQRWNSEMINKS